MTKIDREFRWFSSVEVFISRFLCLSIFLLTVVFGVACSIYHEAMTKQREAVLHSREDALKGDLRVIRQAINQHSSEKGVPPQSLDDLVRAGYFREVPIDPITEQRDWNVIVGSYNSKAGALKGLVDVHSSSTKRSSNGTLYSDW